MPTTVNTYEGGMNQDLSLLKDRQTIIYEGNNIQIITEEGNSTGAVRNTRGNVAKFKLRQDDSMVIIGATMVRNTIVVFGTFYSSTGGGGPDIIATGTNSSYYNSIVDLNIIWEGDLGFSQNYPIVAKGKYETPKIQKVYFTDYNKPLRYFNLATLQISQDPGLFDIVPDIAHSLPEITNIESGGEIPVCKIQYAYQMYQLNGADTKLSPITQPIHMTTSSEGDSKTSSYYGALAGQSSGKSVRVKISDIDSARYNKIKLYAIQYLDEFNPPTIRLVEDTDIGNNSFISILDSGKTLGTLTVAQLNSLSGDLFTCKALEAKDNMLFAGNIKPLDLLDDNIDNFDARTYRFDSSHNCKVFEDNNDWYQIDGDNNYAVTDNNGNSIGDWNDIPKTADVINKYNDSKRDNWSNTNWGWPAFQYKFRYPSSKQLGGKGPNISYEFNKKETVSDVNHHNAELYTTSDSSYSPTLGNKGTVFDDPTTTPHTYSQNSFSNFASPYLADLYRGYQREEVYRFGIVFIDEKGRHSFVKWIGDIKMPSMAEHLYGDVSLNDAKLEYRIAYYSNVHYKNITNQLYVEFNVQNVPTNPNTGLPYDYKIVRVKRDDADRSVLAQGLMGVLKDDDIDNYPSKPYRLDESIPILDDIESGTNIWSVPYKHDVTEFASPEVSFNPTNFNTNKNNYYKWVGYGDDVVYFGSGRLEPAAGYTLDYYPTTVNTPETKPTTGQFKVRTITPINDIPLIQATPSWARTPHECTFTAADHGVAGPLANSTFATVAGLWVSTEVYPQDDNISSINTYGIGGTTLISKLNLSLKDLVYEVEGTNSSGRPIPKYFFCNYKSDVFDSQYGGNTYSARANNTYIDCFNYVKGKDFPTGKSTVEVFGGDTYVQYFDYLRSGWRNIENSNYDRNISIGYYFPVETVYNCSLRQERAKHNFDDLTGYTGQFMYLREVPGASSDRFGTVKRTQDYYLYKDYNKAYKREPDVLSYFPKPLNFQDTVKYDVLTKRSEVKTNGELVDNWTNFRANNVNEADSSFGEITSLRLFKNNLLFFQPQAVGIWAVNEKQVLADDPATLTIGTGGILTRYDYISTHSGCAHRYCPVVTDNNVIYYDIYNNKMMSLNSAKSGLSMDEVAGMSSYFNNNVDRVYLNHEIIDNPFGLSFPSSIISTYHKGRVYMTFLQQLSTNNHFTISFDTRLKKFDSFHSFLPSLYLDTGQYLLTAPSGLQPGDTHNNDYLYLHDAGEFNHFYGSYYDSTLTLAINGQNDLNKVWTNIFFTSQAKEGDYYPDWLGHTIPNDLPIRNSRITNDYQDTGDVQASDSFKQRERTWRHQITRAQYDMEGNTLDRRDARIRSPYILLDLTFNSSDNVQRTLHNIKTSYILPKYGNY